MLRDESEDLALALGFWSRVMVRVLACPQVGSGTDPGEGAALAGAVLNALAERTLLTLATTHHASLKDAAVRATLNSFFNASISAVCKFH